MTPSLSSGQVAALCQLGVLLRWLAIAFAGLAGLLAPKTPRLLLWEILAAAVYNGLVTLAILRADREDLKPIALITTIIDQLFCFSFIAIYNVIPGSQQVAAYVPAMLEAVAFFGVLGAALSVGIFIAAVLLVGAAGAVFWRGPFEGIGAFAAIMIVVLLAVCMVGVNRVLLVRASSAEPDFDERNAMEGAALSSREQEVLRLVAQGCSNATIASRLGLSERTVKNSMERLLAQLRARNRAEAVAAASRLRLL
jgi:DNA-binding CsgD family transcriptional regulator